MNQRLPTKDLKITVGDSLIETGNSAWQIKNLTGISTEETRIKITAPEPTFNLSEPKGELTIAKALITFAIVFVIALMFIPKAAFVVAALISLFSVWDGKYTEIKNWTSQKEIYEKKHSAWRNLINNPPVIYSLTIETNSGSKPAFYSIDEDKIREIVHSIRQSMVKQLVAPVVYNINSLDLSGDTNINNIGSTIYEQTISEIR